MTTRHEPLRARFTIEPAPRSNPTKRLDGAWRVLDWHGTKPGGTPRVAFRAPHDGRDRCEAWIAENVRTPFLKGDRVRCSEHSLRPLRDSWLAEGREPMKSRKKQWLDNRAAIRGTVTDFGLNTIGAVQVNVEVDGFGVEWQSAPWLWNVCVKEDALLANPD